ncbi:MAG TPA: hypothetical protein VKB48_10430 [Candidatus Acidoferrum sp.]|nr:hypothetical protein [Candidatus Acidoferrum sp.]
MRYKLWATALVMLAVLATTAARASEDGSAQQGDESTQNSSAPEAKKGPSLLDRWLRMTDQVEETQPDWLSPLATTSGRLKNEIRYDVYDQPTTGGNRQFQLGGNRGVELITSPRTQVLLGVPTYNITSPNGPPSGFGDLPLQVKFRIASAERTEGNYLLTFILAATAPTGAHRYGSGDGVVTPTLAFGKGWGRFDVQSTVGQSLPTGDTTKIGRQFQWNTAFQYRALWKLWPELETNAAFYETGKFAGERQLFLTPGIGFGRVHLNRRFRFSAAVGMQIATTEFHTYNHRWIFSQRISF